MTHELTKEMLSDWSGEILKLLGDPHYSRFLTIASAARQGIAARERKHLDLDNAWTLVNTLCGQRTGTNDYERGYWDAINDALNEIKNLGGRDPLTRKTSPQSQGSGAVLEVGVRPDLDIPCAFDGHAPAEAIYFAPEGCICKTEIIQALCAQHANKAIGNGVDLRVICSLVVSPPPTKEPGDYRTLVPGRGFTTHYDPPQEPSPAPVAAPIRYPARKTLHGVSSENDRLRLLHTPHFVGAITDYNDELTGYDPRLRELDPKVFHYGGNAYYITGQYAREKGWRIEEVEDRLPAKEAPVAAQPSERDTHERFRPYGGTVAAQPIDVVELVERLHRLNAQSPDLYPELHDALIQATATLTALQAEKERLKARFHNGTHINSYGDGARAQWKTDQAIIVRLREALEDILRVIETDQLVPEGVSYMRQARAALNQG